MANLKDRNYTENQIALEIIIRKSEYHAPDGISDWVHADLAFDFGERFQRLIADSDGQSIDDIEKLITLIRAVTNGQRQDFDFSPFEPDYNLRIRVLRGGKYVPPDDFECDCMIDIAGKSGYCGSGPAIKLNPDREALIKFADGLKLELAVVRKECGLQAAIDKV